MARLIIINGMPGTGKTTLLKHICPHLSTPIIAKDDFKEYLFDYIGMGNKDWSALSGRIAVRMLYAAADELLSSGKDVIIENDFWADFARNDLMNMLQRTGSTAWEIYCVTDAATRRQRFQGRIEDGSRHQGHADGVIGDDEQTAMIRYRPLEIGSIVRFDTSAPTENDYNNLVERIQKILNEGEK